MIALLGNLLLLGVLLVAGWILLIGGTGAALAALLGLKPLTGLLLAAVVPVPGLGWALVWLMARRQGSGESMDDGFKIGRAHV